MFSFINPGGVADEALRALVPTRGVGISGFSNLRASNLLIYIYIFLLLTSEIKPDRVSKKTLPEGLV